ncbi:MAG: permease-like cell division protein FtsX [Alistipes sp.]|nr:permease-like cell division protein FtsX [Alistipes sp.]
MRDDKRLRRKVRRSYVVSTVSIALVLFLMGSVGYMLATALRTARDLRYGIALSVELDDNVDESGRTRIEKELMAIDGVVAAKYVDKQEKINDEEFRRMFEAEIEQIIQDNPLRNSYEVSVSAVDRESLDVAADRMSAIEGVVYVAYPAATIERLHATITKITIVLTAFGGALLIISLILLNNTIRLAIFSRRYLINTLKLVGATKGYIMRPFLGAAAKQGVWAGVTASLLFGGSIAALSGTMPEITTSTAQLMQIGITVAGMILCGVIISLLFTAFAVNKFVNMKSNNIYLY